MRSRSSSALPDEFQPLELAEVSLRRVVRYDALGRAFGRTWRPAASRSTASYCYRPSSIRTVDYNDGAPIGGGDWAYVLYLPTEAATAWYHRAIAAGASLNSLLSEVKSFALGEYLDALAQGAQTAARPLSTTSSQNCIATPGSQSSTSATPTYAFPTTGSRTNCCANEGLPWAGSIRDSRPTCSTVPRSRRIGMRPIRRSTRRSSRPETTTASSAQIQHAVAVPIGDLRFDLRRRQHLGFQARKQSANTSTSRPI